MMIRFHALRGCVVLLAFVLAAALCRADVSAAQASVKDSFAQGKLPGVRGTAWAANPAATPPTYALAKDASEHFTLMGWLKVDAYPDAAQGKFDDASPMTVFDLLGKNGRLLVRLSKGRVQVAVSEGGVWQMLNASAPIEPAQWQSVALVRDGGEFRVYVDGRLDLVERVQANTGPWERLTLGAVYNSPTRRLSGALDEVAFYPQSLDAAQVRAAMAQGADARVLAAAQKRRDIDAWMSFGQFPVVRVGDDVLHPLIDQLSMSTMVVPWTSTDSDDVIVSANERILFGARIGLFRPVGKDARGLPIYDEGQTLKGLTGTQFKPVFNPNGLFDLFALGDDTPYTAKNIVQYVNRGKPGAPAFGEPVPVEIDGQWVSQVVGKDGLAGWSIDDIDGDGTPDILLAIGERKFPYLPDVGGLYSGKPLPNTGPLRGYDIEGNWLGGPVITRLMWGKGRYDADGVLRFDALKKVNYRVKDFALQWVSFANERAMAVLTLEGKRYLVATGNVDHILAMPLSVKDGEVFCGQAQPLLRGGANMHDTYIIRHITVRDMDKDGKPELLLDGNPGRIAVLRGERVGEFEEIGSLQMKGGPVAVDTLAVEERADWDGDGKPDLIVGDSSGYISFWPGTQNPMIYGAPIYMRAQGKTVQHQGGPTGSIQGPSERRWGYTSPAVGDWNGDGKPDLVVIDATGTVTYYARGEKPGELAAPVVFTLDGQPLPAAWRVKPQILPREVNFMGMGKPCLLYLDWDGDLAVAVPKETGGTQIERSVKLTYADGRPVRMSGPVGDWGRATLAVADWDGDGAWDVLFGTNRVCYRSITQNNPPNRSTPMWLKNIGTAQKPVFDEAKLISLKDGTMIDFGVHVAVPAVGDMTGDGTQDLLLGGEDGKIYVFPRETLRW